MIDLIIASYRSHFVLLLLLTDSLPLCSLFLNSCDYLTHFLLTFDHCNLNPPIITLVAELINYEGLFSDNNRNEKYKDLCLPIVDEWHGNLRSCSKIHTLNLHLKCFVPASNCVSSCALLCK